MNTPPAAQLSSDGARRGLISRDAPPHASTYIVGRRSRKGLAGCTCFHCRDVPYEQEHANLFNRLRVAFFSCAVMKASPMQAVQCLFTVRRGRVVEALLAIGATGNPNSRAAPAVPPTVCSSLASGRWGGGAGRARRNAPSVGGMSPREASWPPDEPGCYGAWRHATPHPYIACNAGSRAVP